MRQLKGILLAVLCSTFLCNTTQAKNMDDEGMAYLYYENYEVEEGKLKVYFTLKFPSEGNLSVSLDGQALPISKTEPFSQDEGVSYLFLVDASGSMIKNMPRARDIIQSIVEKMSPADNGALMVFGDESSYSGFFSEKDELVNKISEIEANNSGTDLYSSILKAISVLESDKEVHLRRCIIVLSDGFDNNESRPEQNLIENKIAAAHVPVHTLIFIEDNIPKTESRILGDFSRFSAGGVQQYVPTHRFLNPDGVAQNILNTGAYEYVAQVNLSSLVASDIRGELLLEITSDELRLTDSCSLGAAGVRDIRQGIVNKLSLEELAVADDYVLTVPFKTDYMGTMEPKAFSLLIDDISLTVEQVVWEKGKGGTITALLPRDEKGKKDVTARTLKLSIETANGTLRANRDLLETEIYGLQKVMAPAAIIPSWLPLIGAVAVLAIIAALWKYTVLRQRKGSQKSKRVHYTLQFFDIDSRETYEQDLSEEVIIGSSRNAVQFFLPQQDIQKKHCRIFTKNGKLYIENLAPVQYATGLCGIALNEPQELKQNDILSIGSAQLRVTWERVPLT